MEGKIHYFSFNIIKSFLIDVISRIDCVYYSYLVYNVHNEFRNIKINNKW